jgi:hypothetical protein
LDKFPPKTNIFEFIFFKEVARVGSKPGSSWFHLFSHFHHFTAEPQRLTYLNSS